MLSSPAGRLPSNRTTRYPPFRIVVSAGNIQSPAPSARRDRLAPSSETIDPVSLYSSTQSDKPPRLAASTSLNRGPLYDGTMLGAPGVAPRVNFTVRLLPSGRRPSETPVRCFPYFIVANSTPSGVINVSVALSVGSDRSTWPGPDRVSSQMR